ncbi:MAG: hypothetical protein AUH39_00050, partial [Chloroflexi bacterium 13_1_40CM_67_9]
MGAGDVASEAVADHDRIVRADFERSERRFEDARVGLSDADLGGDDRDLEERRERCVRELCPLDVGRAVGHEPETVIARQISHHRVGVGIDKLHLAARDAKRVHGGVDQTVIANAGRREGPAPDAAAEIRDERTQCSQTLRVPAEFSP